MRNRTFRFRPIHVAAVFLAGLFTGGVGTRAFFTPAPRAPLVAEPSRSAPSDPPRARYRRALFVVNPGAAKTIYLFGQVHPSSAADARSDPRILESQAFIALELQRLIATGKIDRIVGEGIVDQREIEPVPELRIAPDTIEGLLQAAPKETSYILLKRAHGQALDLMSTSEAGYRDPSGDWFLEIDNRTRLFHFDLAKALEDRDAVGAVFGLAHIPRLIHDLRDGSVSVKRDGKEDFRLAQPHVVLYLTGGDYAVEEQWLRTHLEPGSGPASGGARRAQ